MTECSYDFCTNDAIYMDIICEECKGREDEHFDNLDPDVLRA